MEVIILLICSVHNLYRSEVSYNLNLDPAMVAQTPVIYRIERSYMNMIGHCIGREHKVELLGGSGRGLVGRVVCGNIIACKKKFIRPWVCLTSIWSLGPDER
jgi:hypothetical protein